MMLRCINRTKVVNQTFVRNLKHESIAQDNRKRLGQVSVKMCLFFFFEKVLQQNYDDHGMMLKDSVNSPQTLK